MLEKAKGIIFNTDDAKAVLSGNKSVFRRVMFLFVYTFERVEVG